MNSSEPVWERVRRNLRQIAGLHMQAPFRSWRWTTLTLALGLPLVGIFGTPVALAFRSVRPEVRDRVLADLPVAIFLGYPFLVAANLPIFILYWTVVGQARRGRPVNAASRWAALVVLGIVYGFGYVLMPYEMTSGAPDAGQGVGIYLGFAAPLLGGLGACIAWGLAQVVSNVRAERSRR